MQYVAPSFYVMAVGFAMAGVLASFIQLWRAMRFGIEPKSIFELPGWCLPQGLAGPVIQHNAWRDTEA